MGLIHVASSGLVDITENDILHTMHCNTSKVGPTHIPCIIMCQYFGALVIWPRRGFIPDSSKGGGLSQTQVVLTAVPAI